MPVLPALLALAAGLVSMVLVSSLLLGAGLGMRTSVILAEIALVAPSILLVRSWRLSPERALGLRRVSATIAALAAAAGISFWIASAGLIQAQSRIWPPPPSVFAFFQQLRTELRPAGALAKAGDVVALAVAPALAEELTFRGVLLGALAGTTSTPVAVVLSASVFGVIHVTPAGYRIPFAFVLGLALGALRARTGSVVPGMIAHAVLNTITLSLAPWVEDPGQMTAAAPLGPALALLAGGSALSALVLYALARLTSAARPQ